VFSIANISKPQILVNEKDFILVYKPPRMHSAPHKNSNGVTILDWCSAEFPEIAELPGRKPGEGGLLHRLDYETQGLMLLARNAVGMKALLEQQNEGKIIKEYSALTTESKTLLPGFPSIDEYMVSNFSREGAEKNMVLPSQIKSAFRPYGPGRKAVRPILVDKDERERRGER